jgi:hypothetical protein
VAVTDEGTNMPQYRISAELKAGRKTAGYRTSKGTFGAHAGDAQQVTLTPTAARDWLQFTWRHFKNGWSNISRDPIWKGQGLDQVRFVLEEVESDDKAKVVDTTTDWDGMPTVVSG